MVAPFMILVTGGAGFLGAVLVRELLDRGYAVRVHDKLLFGTRGLDSVRGRIELVPGDIRSFDPALLDGVTAVLHLAGLSNDPMAEFNPRANYEINTVGTERVARACRERGVRRFVQASSCSVYDLGMQAEDVLRDETAEVKPRAAYAVSKHDAEKILLDWTSSEFCPVILRMGTIYGFSPRMRYDLVVNTFVKDALTRGTLTVHCGGEMWRPLVEVRDAALAYVAALEAEEEAVRGQVFNLVHRNFRVLELAHAVQAALRGVEGLRPVTIDVSYEAGAARSYRVSGAKAEAVLGYHPQTTVGASVLEMVRRIPEVGAGDFLHPRYYNIQWLQALCEMEETLRRMNGEGVL
jgi:nucleoside-diphosphate-sugar epimerase